MNEYERWRSCDLSRGEATPEEPRARASEVWRRRAGSNRCIAVLQTAPLPLGYGASGGDIIVASFSGTQHKITSTLTDKQVFINDRHGGRVGFFGVRIMLHSPDEKRTGECFRLADPHRLRRL